MSNEIQDVIDFLCEYEYRLSMFLEACSKLKDVEITEHTRKSVVHKWHLLYDDNYPSDAQLYFRSFEDAYMAIRKIFEPDGED